jgi:hypothetical protein
MQARPLAATPAHNLLDVLYVKVREAHRRDCDILEEARAFQKSHELITSVAEHNGRGPYKWSWPKPKRKDQRRVDTEISHGIAFVRDE